MILPSKSISLSLISFYALLFLLIRVHFILLLAIRFPLVRSHFISSCTLAADILFHSVSFRLIRFEFPAVQFIRSPASYCPKNGIHVSIARDPLMPSRRIPFHSMSGQLRSLHFTLFRELEETGVTGNAMVSSLMARNEMDIHSKNGIRCAALRS
jgi:hypothetical protein